MISVTDATKEAFLNGSVPKTITIEFPNKNLVLTNQDLVSESFELTQTLESEPSLTFKGCNASQIKFQAGEIVEDLRGELVTVTIQAGNTEPIKLFTGYVDSQSNLTQEDFITEIVAYDAFYKMSELTLAGYATPSESGEITIDLWRHLDNVLKFIDDNYGLLWYNDNQTYYDDEIAKLLYPGTAPAMSFKTETRIIDVIRLSSAIAGMYGYINADGLLAFKQLEEINKGVYPGQDTIPADDLYPAGENSGLIFDQSDYSYAKYEPFDVEKFSGYKVYLNDGRVYGSTTSNPGNKILIIGSPQETFYPQPSIVVGVRERTKKIWYKPSMIEVQGRPWVELGDSYLFTTRKNVIRSYVLKRTLKGIQALFDTYECEGEEANPNNVIGGGNKLDAAYVNIGTSNTAGNLTVNGHTVTFKDITISGTTYHLLGYTD